MSLDLKGLKKISKNIKKLEGENTINLNELFSSDFLIENSCFSSFDEMIEEFGINFENQEDFNNISESEEWENFIVSNTNFGSYEEMLNKAVNDFVIKNIFK